MKNTWQLQEAKAKFSELVNKALRDGPQIITKHGKETALLISLPDYKKSTRKKSKISRFFRESPLASVELDLSRSKDTPRDIEI